MVNNNKDNLEKNVKNYILGVIFGVIIFVAIFGSVYTVGAGERGIILTWGKPSDLEINSGLHFKIPIAQKVVKIDVQTQKYNTDASASSSDLQIVSTKIAVNYHLTVSDVVSLYKNIGVHYEDKVIQPAVQEIVKACTAKFTAEELITRRELVKECIDFGLKNRLFEKGINLETTSITNFDFSDQFNQAIETKVTAEQNALTEKNRLAQVEFVAMQKVAEANGTAQSIILRAEADARARLVVATAEAEALGLQRQQASDNVLELRRIEVQKSYADNWDGQLPTTVIGGSGAIPLLQLPMVKADGSSIEAATK